MLREPGGEGGFTFVELLLAVGISALLSVVLGEAVVRMFTTVPASRANLTGSDETRRVVDAISSDVHRAATLQVTQYGEGLLMTYDPNSTTTVAVNYEVSGTTLSRVESTNGSGTSTRMIVDDLAELSFQYSTTTSLVTGTVVLKPEQRDGSQVSTTWNVMARVTPQ